MYATLTRHNLGQALRKLLPTPLPPTLTLQQNCNLYRILSRTPKPAGTVVHQTRWNSKRIKDSYWVVTRANIKCGGEHGRAWGILYWKGKQVSPQPELIRGGLKFTWALGRSNPSS
ncbi:hypothetical protein AGABI1DRAFT_100033 [Agaricus bisporus var. burnettii JB137-S8]|uniref:Uncharacterized protein n=2 Tax=Agaricus bisporus var. burnettii TaxID=192524 RepID=K5W0W2_AGABU|nr:uncharacterized protein AGABI1DRAFT_100033 [Agaricus bisporus var. burnettii JB137-S8]EKM80434.1 hypothetical protein AGABI1DRAFT_100033 [Agaricus bisporus var. burnettii JB137-S8]KAF7776309.1 hypothetical protein Agabi119p4_4702 [Agaricus bisporus var. burnettii]